jgi:tryptophan synthase beta chain
MARPKPLPDAEGYFGRYGGRFVPETLMTPLAELTRFYDKAQRSRVFRRDLTGLLNDFAGRPTPLYFAERLS